MNNESNKITNPKVETPKGIALNDKDHIGGLLSELKCMEKNYAVALTEASNETLYDIFKTMFDEVSNMQREVYELMFRCGWYPMEPVENNKLTEKINTLSQQLTDLSS